MCTPHVVISTLMGYSGYMLRCLVGLFFCQPRSWFSQVVFFPLPLVRKRGSQWTSWHVWTSFFYLLKKVHLKHLLASSCKPAWAFPLGLLLMFFPGFKCISGPPPLYAFDGCAITYGSSWDHSLQGYETNFFCSALKSLFYVLLHMFKKLGTLREICLY